LALRSRCDEWINCLQNFQCGIKADVATLEALSTAFRQNFGNVSPCNNEQPAQHRRNTSRAGERTQTMGGLLGSQERTKEPPRRNPAMSIYRFRALKVSHGRKHHGIVTKTQTNDGCDGRRGYGGRSGERRRSGSHLRRMG
jgi:hypothetical protein